MLPNYKNRLNARDHVISLVGARGLRRDRAGRDRRAGADHASSPRTGRSRSTFPGSRQAAREVSSPPLRNLGTVGGNLLLDTRCYYFNQSEFWRASKGYCLKADGDVCLVVPQKEICYATYSGDLAPVFLVLDASMELSSPERHAFGADARVLPLRRHRALRQAAERAPDAGDDPERIARGLATGYRKLRVRDTIEYPVMGVAHGPAPRGRTWSQDLRVAVTGSEAVPALLRRHGPERRARRTRRSANASKRLLLERVKTYRNVPFPPGYRRSMGGRFARALYEELRG